MSERKKYPEIRYGQFTDAWEQLKLGDLASSLEYGLNAAAKDFDGVNKYLRITDIDENSREFVKDGLTSPDIELDKADNYLLSKGDILFARTGASVGKTYKYRETDGKVYYAGFLIRAHINEDNDSEFVYQKTLTDAYDNFIKITSQRSGQPGVNAHEYASFKLAVPSKYEQVKIGDFFKQIDELITLQQRKYEKTVNMKNALLEKMFPKNGEDKPEIRFEEFSYNWERRNLSDIVAITGGGTPSTVIEEYWNGDIDWYSPTEIGSEVYATGSVKKITEQGLAKSSAKILPANRTILFTSRAGIGDMAILAKDGATNQGFQSLVLDEKTNVYFLYSMGYKIKKYALKNASGSTFLEISGKVLGRMEVFIPTLEEQNKIGAFFKEMDQLITLQHQELEKLKNIKKALLQKMLV